MEKFWQTVSAYDSRVSRPCSSSGNFCGSEIRHRIFGRLHFGPRNFFFFFLGGEGGGCLKPLGFFWILIIAPIRSSLALEIWSTPASGPEGVHLRD